MRARISPSAIWFAISFLSLAWPSNGDAQQDWASLSPFGTVSFDQQDEVDVVCLVAARALRASTGEVVLLREVWRNSYMDYSCFPSNNNGPWLKLSLHASPEDSFATVLDRLSEQSEYLKWSFNEKYSVIHVADTRLLKLSQWPLNREIDVSSVGSLTVQQLEETFKQEYGLHSRLGGRRVSLTTDLLADVDEPTITVRELMMKALFYYRTQGPRWFEVFPMPEICNGFGEVQRRADLAWSFWTLNASSTLEKTTGK